MWKKVLSFTVLCTFIISNVCYAVPAIGSVSIAQPNVKAGLKNSVDNMALRSFLQTGAVGELEGNKAAFASMLQLLTTQTYTEEKVTEIINMWRSNLAEGKLASAADRLTAVREVLKNNVEFNEATGDVRVTRNGELFVEVANGKVNVGTDVTQGNSGKAESQEKKEALIKEALLSENLATLSMEEKEVELNKLRTVLDKAVAMYEEDTANGIKEEDRIGISREFAERMNSAVAAKDIQLMGTVAYDENNYITSHSNPEANFLNRDLTDRTDMLAHEVLEGMGFNDKQILGIQMKIHGIRNAEERKTGNNPMAQTRSESLASVAKTLEAKAAAAETPAKDDIEVDRSLLKATGAAAEQRAMEISMEACPEGSVARTNLELAGPAGALIALKTLLGDKLAKLVGQFKGFIDSLVLKASNEAKVAVQDIVTKAAEYIGQGNRIAFVKNMMFKEEKNTKGEVMMVPRFGAAMIFKVVSMISTEHEGIINITNAGTQAEMIRDTLETLYPELGKKVRVYEGKEGSILDELNGDATKLRVLYINENDIDNISGVAYIKSTIMDRVNGLKVLFTVLAPNLNTLSNQEQEALTQLQDGRFELKNVEVAVDSDYKAMEADFLKAVKVALQA
ncbi:MAG: hypothetical protein KJ893_02970 [Candidatus Omnitrophica bacterium]|nr:hypothetical protein [Candidatus Omnitrophota bacterium]